MEHQELLLAFYGDDFTGSTDAMEALTGNGYRTILFLEPPTPSLLARFEGVQCIGVAGTSRAKNPTALAAEVMPVIKNLAATNAKIVHYKTCSTFDSSPQFGSIGEAIRVSRPYFSGQKTVPLLVGAPALGRYTLFGHHFAKFDQQIFRLDRHPVMSRHPVTPMQESDLRAHLKQQLDEEMELFNVLELDGAPAELLNCYRDKLSRTPSIVLFDVLDEERLKKTGALIWHTASTDGCRFVVGSSGVEYALTAHWQSEGMTASPAEQRTVQLVAAKQLLVVSGSASPVSQQQIKTALAQGFKGLRIPPEALANQQTIPTALLQQAIEWLVKGESVILYTALGPDDTSIEQTRNLLMKAGISSSSMGEYIGRQLGKWTKLMMCEAKIRRIVIAGGDTSGFVTSEMGIYGLEMLLPISPGAPLCTVYSSDEQLNGIELALKGGQFGSADYYEKVRLAASNL